MKERILFDKCPLCACSNLDDCKTGNCSKHPLYNSELSSIIRWKQCSNCAHIFTEGYFSEDACKLIYSKTQKKQQVGFQIEQQRSISSRMIEKILPYVSSGQWLDVGFGNGALILTAHEYGFTPIGLDLRADNIRRMASLGVECHCTDITELTLESKCSVISMADILEHIPYPKNALQAAHNLLIDKGILFISMPNIESIIWKLMDKQNVNPYWGEIEHYHNFSRASLYRLLQELNFEPIRYGISERYRACMEVIAQRNTIMEL
jgi:2-polyprenyl-3-methyl-5-hydroxy-6-metoxy-1,4-benzoquinol methylase